MLCFQEGGEEPATDGDSDHTDSEGSVDSRSTCELIETSYNFLSILSITQTPPSFSMLYYVIIIEKLGMGLG